MKRLYGYLTWSRCSVALLSVLAMLACISAPAMPAQPEDFITLSADNTRWFPDEKVLATGNVQASYKNFKVTSDAVEADMQTNIAVFRGNVKLSTGQYNAVGEQLTLNMKTRDWSIDKASSRIEPASLQGNISGSAFVNSAVLSGHGDDLALKGGTFTTCDLNHPHYYFRAGDLEIYPNSRIVAHKVSVVGLDKRLITLNSLVIPIRGFRANFVPQIGQSAEEGMFLKAAYAYAATERSQGFLKLDLMSKRGIGTGVEHSYRLGASSGLASLYYLYDRELGAGNLSGRLQHQQSFGSINLNLTADYRTNNYLYYPSTTQDNSEIMLSRNAGGASTSLAFRRNGSGGSGSYRTYTTSLRHTQRFSDRFSANLSADMRDYWSSGFTGEADRELESGLDLRYEHPKYDLSLIASKRVDLDDKGYTGDDYYSSLDQLPELALETDTYRSGVKLPFDIPGRLKLVAGRYHETPSNITANRLLMQFDMLGKTLSISDRSELNLNLGLRQAIYASDMAQYVLKANGILSTRFNDFLKTRVAYSLQRPEGFSPFRFDYAGSYNYVRAVMDYQDNEKMRWSLSTGYDFRQTAYPWQDLTLRMTAHAGPRFGYSVATGYNLSTSKWRSLITRFQIGNPDRLALDLGTRYNVEDGKVDLLRSRFDVPIGKLWRVEGLIGWNGYSKQYDYRSVRLTRDLHCWEASLVWVDETGFRNDRGLRLDFRIKAFGAPQDRFGIGQYGQAFDTSMGEFYY